MILSFGDRATEDIYHGDNTKDSRRVPKGLWPVIHRKLDMLHAAAELKDLMSPPGNRLEMLKGLLKDYYSIRVNDQFRIVFQFSNGQARSVKVTDYH